MFVIKNTVWLSVCRIAADLSGLVLFTVISRRYGPMGTGEYSYAFALGAFIAILATSGIEQYGVSNWLASKRRRKDPTAGRACWSPSSIQLSIGLVILVRGDARRGDSARQPRCYSRADRISRGMGIVPHALMSLHRRLRP